ncbi:DUF1275 domain-containing protein [Ideonella azotifigens]|uniref:YoaK family protein n=2 Tax=Ideonella azotifigens TaxID=513160 RepID=A0ABP3VRZ8_9BURK|nr:YoaK family protein [Ideonella azotifigens]MCD2340361.1 DUF1275 domain-containing protein [Ideonella azotifigens]
MSALAPSPMSSTRATALGVGLGFVAGHVDTVGFVALFGLFTAHVTGNFVLIGSTLAHAGGSVTLKLLVFPAFVLAVAATRLLSLALGRRGMPLLRPLLSLQLLLLAGFMVLGWAASPVEQPPGALGMWAGVLGAAAMGVQNAAAKLALGQLVPTTVMTGNVTQLVIDAVDLLRGASDAVLRERMRRFVGPILAFTVGAVGGGFGYLALGFASLLLPIGLLAALALTERTAAAAPAAPR